MRVSGTAPGRGLLSSFLSAWLWWYQALPSWVSLTALLREPLAVPRASFLPHMEPHRPPPSKWGQGRFSLWSCGIRGSGCFSFGRYQDMTS